MVSGWARHRQEARQARLSDDWLVHVCGPVALLLLQGASSLSEASARLTELLAERLRPLEEAAQALATQQVRHTARRAGTPASGWLNESMPCAAAACACLWLARMAAVLIRVRSTVAWTRR